MNNNKKPFINMPKKYRLPDEYEIPKDVCPEVKVAYTDSAMAQIERIKNAATDAAREQIISAIVKQSIEVKVDPEILEKQANEIERQAKLLNEWDNLKEKISYHPVGLGYTVFLLDNGKIFKAIVIKYEQCLSPVRGAVLSYVDLHITVLDIVVRRYCHEFGKVIFETPEEARTALKQLKK